MYTLTDTKPEKRKALKTSLVYLILSALCILIHFVYSLFGHGVTSAYMSLMFLYPLLGGAVIFFLVWLFRVNTEHIPHYRAWYNLYNSGIATLTAGSMMKGVFEIAGTSSPYILPYFIIGLLLSATGALGCIISCLKRPRYIRVPFPQKNRRPEHGTPAM